MSATAGPMVPVMIGSSATRLEPFSVTVAEPLAVSVILPPFALMPLDKHGPEGKVGYPQEDIISPAQPGNLRCCSNCGAAAMAAC